MWGFLHAIALAIGNPWAWYVGGVVGFFLWLLGAPLLVVALAVLVVFLAFGIMQACENCSKFVHSYASALQDVLSNTTTADFYPTSYVPKPGEGVLYIMRGGTYIEFPAEVSFNVQPRQFKVWADEIKANLSSRLPGKPPKIEVLGVGISQDDYIVPIGNLSNINLQFRRLIVVKDKFGNIVQVREDAPTLSFAYAVIAVKDQPDCATCGKDPNAMLDEQAFKEGKPSPRRVNVVKFPSSKLDKSGIYHDDVAVYVAGWQPPVGSTVEVYYGSNKDVGAMYVVCCASNSNTNDKSVQKACSYLNCQTDFCPTGPIYRPQAFVKTLQTYGFVDPYVLRIARFISNYAVTGAMGNGIPLDSFGHKFAEEFKPVLKYRDEKGQWKEMSLSDAIGQVFTDRVIVDTAGAPYSMEIVLEAPTRDAPVRSATIYLDPYGVVPGPLMGVGGVAFFIKTRAGDRLRIPVVTPCFVTMIKANIDRRNKSAEVYVYTPPGYRNIVNQMRQWLDLMSKGILDHLGCASIVQLFSRLKEEGIPPSAVKIQYKNINDWMKAEGEVF